MTQESITIRATGAHGAVSARISLLGGGVREFTYAGRAVIPSDSARAYGKWYSGVVMSPFANRVRDGRWSLEGVQHQLPLNDPLGHALHGLVAERRFTLVSSLPDAVELECDLEPMPGYPFATTLRVAYAVGDGGLQSTMTITNRSDQRIPVVIGAHPYFAFSADSAIVVAADQLCDIDGRKIPTGELIAPQAKGVQPHVPTPLDALELDDTFTGLRRDHEGRAHTVLRHPDGVVVDVWQGEGFDYVVVFISPESLWQDDPSSSIAIEPQTGPTDALNSGTGLVWLEPGQSRAFTWGVAVEVPAHVGA